MRTVKLRQESVDAAQLREELAEANLSNVEVADPDAAGDIVVSIPPDVYGPGVAALLRQHFPRSLVAAIAAVDFEAVDFDSPTTIAGLKAALNQNKQRSIELRNRVVRALRARWGGDRA